jgi:hypothetical protein
MKRVTNNSKMAMLVVMFAITFTFNACSSDAPDDPNNPGGNPNNGGGASCGKLMSQNLNVDVAGSVCYDNDPANCEKYGRLYDWATAMKFPAKCNETLSTTDPECAIQNNHRGICPSGQHIPSIEELNEYGSYECLKNQPGGGGNSVGNFSNVGGRGFWWSGSEYNSSSAYYRVMRYGDEGVGYSINGSDKSGLHSVRCVKDKD